MAAHPNIVHVQTQSGLIKFSDDLRNQTIIAMDIEGVNLSRAGELSLISVGIPLESGVIVYVFDMVPGTNPSPFNYQVQNVLKKVFENDAIKKIIHDPRMDSDALKAKLDIKLQNVFDTSIAHQLINRLAQRENLNNTLKANGCKINENRPDSSKDFYRQNPTYWATRPLTQKMVMHAGDDVANLPELFDKLMAKIGKDEQLLQTINAQCVAALDEFRALAFHEIVQVPARHYGYVIGPRGSNLKNIQTKAGVIISSQSAKGFLVLSSNEANITKAKQLIRASYQ